MGVDYCSPSHSHHAARSLLGEGDCLHAALSPANDVLSHNNHSKTKFRYSTQTFESGHLTPLTGIEKRYTQRTITLPSRMCKPFTQQKTQLKEHGCMHMQEAFFEAAPSPLSTHYSQVFTHKLWPTAPPTPKNTSYTSFSHCFISHSSTLPACLFSYIPLSLFHPFISRSPSPFPSLPLVLYTLLFLPLSPPLLVFPSLSTSPFYPPFSPPLSPLSHTYLQWREISMWSSPSSCASNTSLPRCELLPSREEDFASSTGETSACGEDGASCEQSEGCELCDGDVLALWMMSSDSDGPESETA